MKKRSLFLAATAAVAATFISLTWQPLSFQERAVQLQIEQSPPDLVAVLNKEPLGVKAVLLDYANDPVLRFKAQAAVLKYPQFAREILPLYGDAPEFQEILLAYGESVLPPIDYFLNHDVYTTDLAHHAGRKITSLKTFARRLLGAPEQRNGAVQAAPQASATQDESEAEKPLTREQRGWYAVNYIRGEGHDFLGQFVVDGQGQPKWIQSERLLEDASALFMRGIKDLETKAQTHQTVTAGDVGSATLDMFVMASAIKLVRLGEAAAASDKSLSISTRTAALSSRAARGTRLALKIAQYGKWPALAVTAYMALRHPSIISDALADLAHLLGLPTWLGLFAGWTLILLPAFYLGSWVARVILRPTVALLRGILHLLSRLEDATGKKKNAFRYSSSSTSGRSSY
jgi:hypothetical protein